MAELRCHVDPILWRQDDDDDIDDDDDDVSVAFFLCSSA